MLFLTNMCFRKQAYEVERKVFIRASLGRRKNKNLHFSKNPGDVLLAGLGMRTGGAQRPVATDKHPVLSYRTEYRLMSPSCEFSACQEGLPHVEAPPSGTRSWWQVCRGSQ